MRSDAVKNADIIYITCINAVAVARQRFSVSKWRREKRCEKCGREACDGFKLRKQLTRNFPSCLLKKKNGYFILFPFYSFLGFSFILMIIG